MKERRIAVRFSKAELQIVIDALDILNPDSDAGEKRRVRLMANLEADKERCFGTK